MAMVKIATYRLKEAITDTIDTIVGDDTLGIGLISQA